MVGNASANSANVASGLHATTPYDAGDTASTGAGRSFGQDDRGSRCVAGWPRRLRCRSPQQARKSGDHTPLPVIRDRILSVSNSLSGRHWELDQVPAVGDLTDIVQLGTGHHVSAGEGQRRVALQRRVAAHLVVVGQTPGATQRCLNPGFSERIRNSRRTAGGGPDGGMGGSPETDG